MEQSASSDQPSPNPQPLPAAGEREVHYEHTPNLADVLSRVQATLLISTYQAGKLIAIGSHDGQLALSFHNFDHPMGVAVNDQTSMMAVAARNKIWFLRNARDIAPSLEPAGCYSDCFLTRSADVTGEIQAHEVRWAGDELWVVNTLFSCLCTLDARYSFVPRWQPRFVSRLAAEDCCHLNGLAVVDGRPKYVTVLAETDTPGGWRPNKVNTGCLLDVDANETIARGFAMPHSPRVHMGHVWLLDSGRGALVRVDRRNGQVDTVARFPGYARGLAMHGTLAFVGLSKIRETSTFSGVPIAENRERLKCGVGIVDVSRGELIAQFELKSGVDEIFDVTLLAGTQMAALRGPFASEDGVHTIWVVPPPGCRQEQIS